VITQNPIDIFRPSNITFVRALMVRLSRGWIHWSGYSRCIKRRVKYIISKLIIMVVRMQYLNEHCFTLQIVLI